MDGISGYGDLWSSSLNENNSNNGRNLNFNHNGNLNDNNWNRYIGLCILGKHLYFMKLTKEQLFRDIYIAFVDAKKHKSNKIYVKEFEVNLKENLEELCNDLWNRNYEPGRSTCFIVHHPSKREVFAAEFRDRIVHHL